MEQSLGLTLRLSVLFAQRLQMPRQLDDFNVSLA